MIEYMITGVILYAIERMLIESGRLTADGEFKESLERDGKDFNEPVSFAGALTSATSHALIWPLAILAIVAGFAFGLLKLNIKGDKNG